MLPKIGFDLDGCLVDLVSVIKEVARELYGLDMGVVVRYELEKQYQLSPDQVRSLVHVAISRYTECKPYPGALEFLYSYIQDRGEKAVVITSRSPSTSVYTKRWFDVWFGVAASKVDICYVRGNDKLSCINDLGIEVYIEDRVKYAKEIARGDVRVVLMDRSWNRHLKVFSFKDRSYHYGDGHVCNIVRMYGWYEVYNYFFNRREFIRKYWSVIEWE